jgi:phosphatidylglycerophosphatase A
MKKALLSFFGVGFVPMAPGTAASAVAIALHSGMLLLAGRQAAVTVSLVVAFMCAVVTAVAGAPGRGEEVDPAWIVSDEVAGQLVAVLLAGRPAGVLAAFAGFRVLDIVKPFPIRRLEGLPGGLGVLADDLASGLGVALALGAAQWLVPAWRMAHL